MLGRWDPITSSLQVETAGGAPDGWSVIRHVFLAICVLTEIHPFWWVLYLHTSKLESKISKECWVYVTLVTRWWFQIFFVFTPTWGRWTHFDEHIFQMDWFNHQPVYHLFHLSGFAICPFFGGFKYHVWTGLQRMVKNSTQAWWSWTGVRFIHRNSFFLWCFVLFLPWWLLVVSN